MRQKGMIVLVSVLLVAAAAAAQSGGGSGLDNIQLSLNQSRDVTISIENPLNTADTITLDFTGGAVEQGIVRLTVRDCAGSGPGNYPCDITVDGQSTQQVDILVEASSVGQEALIMEGTSGTTQLTAEDSVSISVDPLTQQGIFSSPGLTIEWLLLLATFATGFYYLARHE